MVLRLHMHVHAYCLDFLSIVNDNVISGGKINISHDWINMSLFQVSSVNCKMARHCLIKAKSCWWSTAQKHFKVIRFLTLSLSSWLIITSNVTFSLLLSLLIHFVTFWIGICNDILIMMRFSLFEVISHYAMYYMLTVQV